jgi:hypothetical protein
MSSRTILPGVSAGSGLNGPLSKLKHLIYSRYKSWRVFEDSQLTTAISFCSQDPSKIFVAYGWEDGINANIGAELRLYDVKTHYQYAAWNNLHEIERIVVPHNCNNSFVILQVIKEQISFNNSIKKYGIDVYRPTDFSSPITSAPSMCDIALNYSDNAVVGYKTPTSDIDPMKLLVVIFFKNPLLYLIHYRVMNFLIIMFKSLFDLETGLEVIR